MANVNDAVADLYGSGQGDAQSKNRRMTEHSRKWSSSGLGLDAAEAEARRLEKKGTFSATMDDEAGTVTLSKDDFKAVMGKLGGHKQTAKRSQSNFLLLAFGYLAVSIGFIAVIVGLMNWRIEASKESHVVGGSMVAKDGSAVKTAEVLSFAGLFDLPKLDVKTLVQTKRVVAVLETGEEMAFIVTGAIKRPNSRLVKLLTPGGLITVNGDTMMGSAAVDGVVHKIKKADQAQRRMLREEGRQLLHKREDFFSSRALSASAGSSAELTLLAGSEGSDSYDGNDPVSGSVQISFNNSDVMTILFQANARISRRAGQFSENGDPLFQMSVDGTTTGVEVSSEPGRFINIVQGTDGSMTILSNDFVATGLHNGTFQSTYCSSEPISPVVSVSSNHADVTVDLSAINNDMGFTHTVVLDDVFKPLVMDPTVVEDCGAKGMNGPVQSRRLAETDPAMHFKKYYHEPITTAHAKIPKEEWTDEHHMHAKSLDLIRELYGREEELYGEKPNRQLARTDASNAAQDVYASATCVNAVSWMGGFKGQACYLKRGCMFAFRGSDDNADWADNILGAVWVEYHNGKLVHKGFINQLNQLVSGTSINNEVAGCGNPIFVGHSLGGAMSYAARAYWGKGRINNYAAPAAYLAHYLYWNPGSGSQRTWHANDPVPYATNIVKYQHTFGSRKIYQHCSSWHQICFPYPCGCGWRGCRTCWGGCFNAWCKRYENRVTGGHWSSPHFSKWGTIWDIGRNIGSFIRGGTHFHSMSVHYQPYGA